jgi:mono/diheme cytochrome c family protein
MKEAATAMLPAALLIGLVFSATASAQTLQKDSNTKSALTASGAEKAVSGNDLFQEHCASCHFATTTAQKIGPGLKGMYARPFSDGKKVTDAGLVKWIEAGGKNMPGFKETIKAEQVRALISYLKTL